jgi:nucleoside-diphosphate-sugar epimerase
MKVLITGASGTLGPFVIRALLERHNEDVARAHQLLLEAPATLPPHDVHYVTANDTTALKPSRALLARFAPNLLPLTDGLEGHDAFFSTRKLTQAVGWQHQASWRG